MTEFSLYSSKQSWLCQKVTFYNLEGNILVPANRQHILNFTFFILV